MDDAILRFGRTYIQTPFINIIILPRYETVVNTFLTNAYIRIVCMLMNIFHSTTLKLFLMLEL
jgi:hypothetical protein